MKGSILPSLALLACGLFLSACGHKASEANVQQRRAFESAQPEIKQTWDLALEAGRTNDYFTAQTLLWKLNRQELSPEQDQAVKAELAAVNQRLSAALDKGDPAAQAALQQLRQNPPNR